MRTIELLRFLFFLTLFPSENSDFFNGYTQMWARYMFSLAGYWFLIYCLVSLTLPGSLSKSQSRLASLLKPHVPGPKTNWKLVPVATIAYKQNKGFFFMFSFRVAIYKMAFLVSFPCIAFNLIMKGIYIMKS